MLVAVVQHLPEWLKNRTAWYIQSFNICELHAGHPRRVVVGALLLGQLAASRGETTPLRARPADRGSSCSSALNHSLLAPMLLSPAGIAPRESGLFTFQSLSTELVLAALGVGSRRSGTRTRG